ncbi:hypothetical protein Mrose_03589 [Calidithermus roseus]|uniref:Uncharacterized protein n=1 Tax=Calidithermus roseus TaxID=1644118 RepID=A0A399ECW4_9DEIN|nr:hypothetical protein Mrose_03589 [Calidithermus roseus]
MADHSLECSSVESASGLSLTCSIWFSNPTSPSLLLISSGTVGSEAIAWMLFWMYLRVRMPISCSTSMA